MKTKTLTKFGLALSLSLFISVVAYSQARVQVIHNSADLAAETVDVWLNDALLLDDFSFRTASGFIDAPAGVDFDVSIQPSNSTDTIGALAKFTYNLIDGNTYILVANGIVSSSGYTPATPFNIDVFSMGREMASMNGNTDVLVYHGSTDAPMVDVYESSVPAGTIVDDLAYSNFSDDYLELPTADYILDIQDETGSATVARYEAPLSSLDLDDEALVVLASGFFDPSMNNNGPAFGLYVALPAGGDLVALPAAPLGVNDVNSLNMELNVYPIPSKEFFNIDFKTDKSKNIQIELYDILGNELYKMSKNNISSFNERINVGGLSAGIYYLVIDDQINRETIKIQVL